MTIYDEEFNSKKYDYLLFVEFQEMLCRICVVGFDPEVFYESLAWKVQFFVEKIYHMYLDRGLLTGDEEFCKLIKTIADN